MKDFAQVEEKILAGLLITATVLVAQGYGNRCGNKGEIELYDEQNPAKYMCWPFPECHDGQEPSVEPGSTHPSGTDVSCRSCQQNFYSNKETNMRCRKCTSCGKKIEISPCLSWKDRVCSNRCISNDYYFNSTDNKCHRCTECCEGDNVHIEPQCITMKFGTLIGGKGQNHCRRSSKPCNDLPKKNLTTSRCDCNCTMPSNCSLLKGSDRHINHSLSNNISLTEKELPNQKWSSSSKQCGSHSFDDLHIILSCLLGLSMVVIIFLGWLSWKRRKQSSQSDESLPSTSFGLSGFRICIPTCTSAASAETRPFLPSCNSCKLNFIPEDVKLDNLPHQVGDKLIEMLDGKKPPLKNWWDVARRIEIPESDLWKIKREEDREAGSPTTQLLSYLSAMERVFSLKEFVQFIHSLKRHDICRAITEFYQNQNSTE